MIYRILTIYIAVLLLNVLVISCRGRETCDANLNEVKIYADSTLVNLSLKDKTYGTLTSVFDSLLFNVQFNPQVSNCAKANLPISFIQEASAWSYAPANLVYKDTIQKIDFFTVRDYNTNYPAGALLNPILVHTFNFSSLGSTSFFPSTDLTQKVISDMSDNSQYHFNMFYSKLTEKPLHSADTVELAMAFTLTNGNVLRDTTMKIVINY